MDCDLITVLGRIELFASLEGDTRAQLATCLTPLRLARGQTLFREGDPGDALYVIESGEVRVMNGAATREICRLGPGEHVGEMSVIDPSPRSATVVARRDSLLWMLSAQDFNAFATRNSQLLQRIAVSLSRRLRDTTAARLQHRSERVVLLVDARGTTHANDALIADLLTALESISSARATVVPLDEPGTATRDDVRPMTDVSDVTARIARIDALLSDHAHVLLRWSSGTVHDEVLRAGVGRADLVLILLSTDTASVALARQMHDRIARLALAELPAVEFALDRRAERARPAFAPIDDLTAGTAVHTVAGTPGYPLAGSPDFSGTGRLARRIANRRVGIAMGGGGARALAHVGVLAELERAGIPIDVLAGTSAGAIVAGLSARDLSAAQIADFLLSRWSRRGVVDWAHVPWLALLQGRKLDRLGKDAAAGLTLQELTRPFVAVATDLVTGEEVRLRRGDGWTAVRASLAMPGLFPPVRLGDRYLVDGGAVNNLPAAAAREAGADIVIGVNVTPPLDPTFLQEAGSPRGFLQGRLASWRKTGLPLVRIVHRAISIQGQALQARQGSPDVTLAPDVAGVDLFEFAQLEPIIERGRLAAQRKLGELRLVTSSTN
jgi:NTE family protein